jgi:2,3-dihydro-2,3-dihydroxybenzoate dehydrogenase
VSGTGMAVVIGAAQGIGEEVARHLATVPWTTEVVLADKNLPLATAVSEDLQKAGHRARAIHVDIADPASIAALAEATAEAEHVAIVAGIFRPAPSLEVEPGDFTEILAVNLIGVFFVAQAYARRMVTRNSGSICAIASIAARVPRMRQAAYCASKAGMRQALRVLALETVPHNVRINVVSPGPTETVGMMRTLAADHPSVDLSQGTPEAFRPRIPDGRIAQPSDVATAVAFLLSPDSGHISMHDLYVDGGESLGL